jgi:hypothetical protein
MSFGTYARRVRNEQLPLSVRYSALRCAVDHYRPLGFNATWAYVTATALPSPGIRRDGSALLRALDVLERSRSVWLEETETFTAMRRTEKARGRRSPRPADRARLHFVLPRWPGRTAPSRLGLVAAVANRYAWFSRLPLPDEPPPPGDSRASRLIAMHAGLDNCAADYLAQLGRLDDAALRSLDLAVQTLRRSVQPGYSSLNAPVLLWLRLANLLDYAARARSSVGPEGDGAVGPGRTRPLPDA